nr:hypothetical protein [Nicotiana tabacum]
MQKVLIRPIHIEILPSSTHYRWSLPPHQPRPRRPLFSEDFRTRPPHLSLGRKCSK